MRLPSSSGLSRSRALAAPIASLALVLAVLGWPASGTHAAGGSAAAVSSPAASSTSAPSGSSTSAPSGPPSSSAASAARLAGTHPTKILVVVEENHSYAQMRSGMPYLYGLAQRYGYATRWSALSHPSLPNYLGLSAGTTFGITDDRGSAAHASDVGGSASVFDQAIVHGRSARVYAESMPSGCYPYDYPKAAPSYAARHNPWTYFSAGRSRCRSYDVPATGFRAAARADRLPDLGLLVPNLCHDAHDCSLGTADSWLRSQLPDVLSSSDFTSGRLVVVVTADEDDRRAGNAVLTTVLSPRLSHKVVTAPLTHYSLTRYMERLVGAPLLNGARTAPDLGAAFGL